MTTVTINNSQQRQVEQRMLVNQLVDNGLMSSVGKIYKRGGMRGLAKKAGSIGGGMASKIGRGIKKTGREFKSGFVKGAETSGGVKSLARDTGKFIGSHPIAGGAAAGSAASAPILRVQRDRARAKSKK